MKAAAFAKPGPPEVLELIDLPDPVPGPGEVRVRVRAAGVQPFDTAIRRGWSPPFLDVQSPQVPGNELAGAVDMLGPGVDLFEIGEEVLGYRVLESYAELVVVPADQLVLKPVSMPWEVAGGFNAGAQTGYGVIKSLGVRRGETMLVNGAAGGLGTVVTQLAQLHGARVIGTASPSNHEYLRSLGAEPVSYGDGLVDRVRALAPDGVDVALDAGGGAGLEASLELVADRSRIGTTVAFERVEELGIADLRNRRSAEQLSALVDLWVQDKLNIHVSELLPLRRAADAHRISEARHLTGKIVLAVS